MENNRCEKNCGVCFYDKEGWKGWAVSSAVNFIINNLQEENLPPECWQRMNGILGGLMSRLHKPESVKREQNKWGHQVSKRRKNPICKSKKSWLVNIIPGRTPGVKTGRRRG